MAIEIVGQQRTTNFSELPWSDPEINLRISMLTEMISKVEHDDMNVLNLKREIATWRELLKRRMQC
jgi:hypothetical protein